MTVFPEGFLWGTATAAYQVEGAVAEDGRAPSIWDTWSHTPGRVEDGHTGDVACDHYHRYREDVELMASLGLNAYRFSVSWPRIVPDGDGAVNEAGLDFYDRLVDALLEHGIAPALTLFHWDLPQALQDRGGWLSRETADAFARYAGIVAGRLGDRVRLWITHNEPWVASWVGHATGTFPPGVDDPAAGAQAAHTILLSHGRAVAALRAAGVDGIGITLNLTPTTAASDREEDVTAAAIFDEYVNRWFLDPVFRGAYPERLWAGLAERGQAPEVHDGDLAEISAPLDFLGVNFYASAVVAADPDKDEALSFRELPPERPVTSCGWPIVPERLPGLLTELTERYDPKDMYITENGADFDDPPAVNGAINDPDRVAFLRGHFEAARRAIEEGVPLRGYFVWTLLDNFEWIWGYNRHFGVVHVDRDTQARTLKDSARFLQGVARENAVPES